LRRCRVLHPAGPCDMPCDACWAAARQEVIRAERDLTATLEAYAAGGA